MAEELKPKISIPALPSPKISIGGKEYQLREEVALTAASMIQSLPSEIARLSKITELSVDALAVIGAFIGAPFGFLPVINDYYRSGLGEIVTYQAKNTFDTYRLDPSMVAQLYLRNFPTQEAKAKWLSDLADNGWNKDRLEAFVELLKALPSIQDVLRFVIREVYTPEIAETFGQFLDYPTLAEPDAAKLGITPELLKKYWAAHWELPAVEQGFEMLHRGIIDESTLKLLLRAKDVMPYWRDKLTQIAYQPYTRVDARRMWTLGVLNDSELVKAYTDIGYDKEHAQKMATWTKLYETMPDLISQFNKKWLTADEVKSRMISYGLTSDRAEWVLKTLIVNPAYAEKQATLRDLSKADILNGINAGILSDTQGLEKLIVFGYDADEADYLIKLNRQQHAAQERDLTRGDIISAFKNGVIDERQATGMLSHLGYEPDAISILLELAIKPISLSGVLRDYLTTKALYDRAVKAGMSPEQLAAMESDVYSKLALFNEVSKLY